VAVGPKENAVFAGRYEHYLGIPGNIPDLYRPPVDVLFGQVLGLYFSLANNLRRDAPSPGGVITRVVGDFKIYE
jgi:tagatose-6-phosphate ketose/aldose isomerase